MKKIFLAFLVISIFVPDVWSQTKEDLADVGMTYYNKTKELKVAVDKKSVDYLKVNSELIELAKLQLDMSEVSYTEAQDKGLSYLILGTEGKSQLNEIASDLSDIGVPVVYAPVMNVVSGASAFYIPSQRVIYLSDGDIGGLRAKDFYEIKKTETLEHEKMHAIFDSWKIADWDSYLIGTISAFTSSYSAKASCGLTEELATDISNTYSRVIALDELMAYSMDAFALYLRMMGSALRFSDNGNVAVNYYASAIPSNIQALCFLSNVQSVFLDELLTDLYKNFAIIRKVDLSQKIISVEATKSITLYGSNGSYYDEKNKFKISLYEKGRNLYLVEYKLDNGAIFKTNVLKEKESDNPIALFLDKLKGQHNLISEVALLSAQSSSKINGKKAAFDAVSDEDVMDPFLELVGLLKDNFSLDRTLEKPKDIIKLVKKAKK